MTESDKNILYLLKCSFCGATPNTVKWLIAGTICYICDKCVDTCVDIIKEKEKEESANAEVND